ncbi:hypothetical protein HYPSUDRAFT_44037 [Hypholoma sublateritium FD-334 SS-4]|uniref:ABC transporter domain-containing protein n=1 Tax=Hypholoma sublateritium (strain FD-334 SS-4) TaxID=945553 RepID=A0A0D2NT56_HYPSF|nr:hypothetical protein HYPSUDRAFT_44037 [Hypholoma sublateritium FD-334 SS-4]
MGCNAAGRRRSSSLSSTHSFTKLLYLLSFSGAVLAARNTSSYAASSNQSYVQDYSSFSALRPPAGCPPCFNCMLPVFTCGQYAECNKFDGQCKCPPGWAGIDCLEPQCDSLADGEQRRPRGDKPSCECKDGWTGVNCNVCKNDNACVGFPLAGGITIDDPDVEVGNMTCYKGGETVFNNHQMCDVTNRKIIDQLPGRPPQVTFSCDSSDKTCAFQFWTAQVESFYCGLENCTSTTVPEYNTNTTTYACEKIKCKCVPGRFICGEDGSIDISDFLTEEIKGPAKFSCKSGDGCKFEEPAMNVLIDQVFGDSFITLKCDGGECLHYSQVPGYVAPVKPDNTLSVALSALGSFTFVLLVFLILWYTGRSRQGGDFGQIHLPENETTRLMMDHVPASLYFSNITYSLGGRTILDNISGCVKPGQIMAIMGASGAGKSTFLDILARKRKRGDVGGTTLVNGREVDDAEFKKVVGYVDQEDTLMSTLTVYETILYSALLRLPREMSIEAKKFRTLETMNELGILGIKDMRIGDSGRRSISGGEKRRVSIACELVTSPSILFLDEPTSGLDAFNASNVVESLVALARTHNRTVVFTIHQPRSNIVALFDQFVVLAAGKLVYSGQFSKCYDYFASIGQPCPPGFNIADFLIDLTMTSKLDLRNSGTATPLAMPEEDDTTNINDPERGLQTHSGHISLHSLAASDNVDTDAEPTASSSSQASATGGYLRHKTSQIFDTVVNKGISGLIVKKTPDEVVIAPALSTLIAAYANSDIAANIKAEGEALQREVVRSDNHQAPVATGVSGSLPDVVLETSMLRGRKRASYGTQFRILSGRAFKNLYRDPALLTAHYTSAIALAVICGMFVHNVTNDIAGFQNRLGIFFFSLALFGFSCLSSLGLFANERILFMRERSNGYYSSFTYFSSKILFDILPLRLVPPLMFGGIVYGLVGFVPSVVSFWKFLLALVLFNLTTASVVLWLSIAFASVSVASLVGTLIMLFNLLFTGLLINRDSMSVAFRWLHNISFFHAAFEALAVNELRYLQLKEMKYGVELDVPAATILSTFGLRAQSYWWPNISLLGIFFVTFTAASYITLHYYVKEKR